MSQSRCLDALVIISTLFLFGCGNSPPSGEVEKEIERAARNANTQMYEAGPDSVDVVSISVESWKKEEMPGAGLVGYSAGWTAKLRFKEPAGFILADHAATNHLGTQAGQIHDHVASTTGDIGFFFHPHDGNRGFGGDAADRAANVLVEHQVADDENSAPGKAGDGP